MARRKKGRPVHGILLLDKPPGGSSNAALQRVKRLYQAQKAGHTGSLDPLATGMLPICLGEATKVSGYLLNADKAYETTLKLGVTTDSADADGTVIETRTVPAALTRQQFEAVCQRFYGPIEQVPPMVSAIRVNGQRLYELARAGQTIERKPRSVVIHTLKVLAFDTDTARLQVRCSKGTYIRSLVTDIGEALGCGAHVQSLRRTAVAPFDDRAMLTLSQLEALAQEGLPALDAHLLPVDAGLQHWPAVVLDVAEAARFCSGQAVSGVSTAALTMGEPSTCRVYTADDQLLGLAEGVSASNDSSLVHVSPRRVLQWSGN